MCKYQIDGHMSCLTVLFKYLIVARLGLDADCCPKVEVLVMLCNVNKHVTDVHWNHPGTTAYEPSSSAAQMCIKPTQTHPGACEHFVS